MSRPLSMYLRARVMLRLAAGDSVRAVTAALSVAPSSVVKWSQRLCTKDSLAPDTTGGHVPPKIACDHRDWLIESTAAAFTLRGLVADLAERGLRVDYRTMWKFVHSHDLSFKKTVLANEQDRADVARKRIRWKARQASVDPRRLVFIDETWAKTNMEPLRGWVPRGERLRHQVPFGHWQTDLTRRAAQRPYRCALRVRRPDQWRGIPGLCRASSCAALAPGDIVVIDNLGSHKEMAVRAAIRAAVARLLVLPPYSPDLNPIEQVFAKLKHLMRKAAERTATATWRRIGSLLDALPR